MFWFSMDPTVGRGKAAGSTPISPLGSIGSLPVSKSGMKKRTYELSNDRFVAFLRPQHSMWLTYRS